MIYLDNAATSLIKPVSVEKSMAFALQTMASPGRGAYLPARKAAETVYECRETAARLFRAEDASHVIFTVNATHALNTAIFSLIKSGDRVLISGFEHNAVTRPLHAIGADVSIAGRELFDREAVLEDFSKKIPGKKAVICTHVSNVFGFILPIYEIAELCDRYGVPLIVDASQSAGVLDVDMKRLRAAYIAMPGHKSLFGPQGTGILLCNRETKPLLYGGSGSDSKNQDMPLYLPERLEAGTANVCGIAGLKAGMEFVLKKGTETISAYEKRLLSIAVREMRKIPGLTLYASEDGNQSGVLSFTVDGSDCESFASRLAEKGICVRAGLHCAPTAHESAGTLAEGTVRMSFSPFVSENDILYAVTVIKNIR